MFEIVPAEEWQLADRIGSERKRRLLQTDYSSIVERIADQIEMKECEREQSKCISGTSRIKIKLALRAQTVDLFHNGAGGYRAQFYLGVKEGEKANRFLIDHLIDRLKTLCATGSGEKVGLDFIEESLRHAEAKTWIYEGAWLTDSLAEDRNLFVTRWDDNSSKAGLNLRFESFWAQLTPDSETMLELKGEYLDASLKPLQMVLKHNRSQEILDFGFT